MKRLKPLVSCHSCWLFGLIHSKMSTPTTETLLGIWRKLKKIVEFWYMAQTVSLLPLSTVVSSWNLVEIITNGFFFHISRHRKLVCLKNKVMTAYFIVWRVNEFELVLTKSSLIIEQQKPGKATPQSKPFLPFHIFLQLYCDPNAWDAP